MTFAWTILSVFGGLAVLQALVLFFYWLSYRRTASSISRFEAVIAVPAAMPVLFLLLWIIRMIAYASGYGLERALSWLWWEPIVAFAVFGVGSLFSHWHRSRLLAQR